jgi:hypothetical protein
MNGLISGLQDLIAYQNSQTVLVQIPPQTDKGILTNTTREKQLLNIIAFNKETINSFYSRLLFWNQNVDPKLLYKVNLICTRDAVDYWIGIDDYLMLLSAFGSNYTNERKDNWGEDKVIP